MDVRFRKADFEFLLVEEHIWLINVSNAEWALLMHLKNTNSEKRIPKSEMESGNRQ